MTQFYEIKCLQGTPLSSWNLPRTRQEIKETFWSYADMEDLFYERVNDEYQTIPKWFTIPFIEDFWEVEVVKIKMMKEGDSKAISKRTIIIDTDNNLVELLQDGYNIIERTIYDEYLVKDAIKLLNEVLEYE